jgi:hypothetical protein
MLFDWNDYYSGSGTLYQQQTSRLSSFSETAYIKNSLFNGISSTSAGGSIFCYSTSSFLMLIESCTFINSITSGANAGAIKFYNTGQFVMVKVCGFGCKSTSTSDQFDYISVTDSIDSKNEIHESAICGTTTSYSYEAAHYRGKVVVKQTNFSSNSCASNSAIYSNPTSNGNSVASSISYSSFTNNIVSSGICILLGSSKLYEIDSCNIISNSDLSSGNGLIKVSGSLNLRGSCILSNSGTYIIYNSGANTITVTNCTIDATSKCYGSTVIVSTPKTSFINKIDHIETALCYANYDSVGSLTVVPNTTKTYPNGIPPDKIEIILEMYCNKHICNEIVRPLNFLLMQLFVSNELY